MHIVNCLWVLLMQYMTSVDRNIDVQHVTSRSNSNESNGIARKRGMVLPFTPFSMSFDSMSYFVDMPQVCSFFRVCFLFMFSFEIQRFYCDHFD